MYLQDTEDPEFNTTIVGPWMENWEIVHHNKHTIKHEGTKPDNAEKAPCGEPSG